MVWRRVRGIEEGLIVSGLDNPLRVELWRCWGQGHVSRADASYADPNEQQTTNGSILRKLIRPRGMTESMAPCLDRNVATRLNTPSTFTISLSPLVLSIHQSFRRVSEGIPETFKATPTFRSACLWSSIVYRHEQR